MNLPFNITTKLTLLFVLFAALLLVGIGVLAYTNGRTALKAATSSGLPSAAVEKEAALNAWVGDHQLIARALANSPRLGEDAATLLATTPTSVQARAVPDRLVHDLQPWAGLEQQYLSLLIIEVESG